MNITGRYSGLFDISGVNFQILGCGGIGSYTAVNLAKMGGMNFNLYDMDIVEAVNVGVSAFNCNHIECSKVAALQYIIGDINPDTRVEGRHGIFDENVYSPKGDDIVLLSFDSMRDRKGAAKIVISRGVKALIDSRMGAETFIMYIFLNPTIKDYERYWHNDEEGDADPCNARATSYCSSMAGAFAANAVRRIITGDQPISTKVVFHFPGMLLAATGRMNITKRR